MKKHKKQLIFIIISIISVFVLIAVISPIILSKLHNDTPEKLANTIGVWLWDENADDKYLTFAKENQVDEIYFCDSSFSDNTIQFIEKANNLGMKVYFLCGEYQWIEDSTNLKNLINQYIEFNAQNPNKSFAGIHLDIEPHQHPNFQNNKTLYLQKYIELVYDITTTFSTINFDFDIPAWFNTIISFDNRVQEAYMYVFDYADRVFVMSYRDTAETIISFASDEIDYARLTHKKLFLCVETGNEEDKVTFKDETKEYMYAELNKLKELLNQEYGISIHHLKTWYDMKDK